jgi:hypothetical protein
MKCHFFSKVLAFGMAASALTLASCSTVETRISGHPEIYQSLSPSDQGLVSQGRIRTGMSPNAVWLGWGSPDQKVIGNMRGHSTETWIYVNYVTPYGYGYGYPYWPYGYPYGFGFGGVGVARTHHGRSFVFVGSPFYDPFFYSYIPPSIPVPYRTVTFANGRVVSFQYLVPPY